MIFDQAQPQVVLPGRERHAAQRLADGSEIIGLRQDDLLCLLHVHRGQPARPVETGSLCCRGLHTQRVIELLEVPQLHGRPGRLGQTGFECHESPGGLCRVLASRESQYLGDVRLVRRADLLEARLVRKIVVALGQRKATLCQPDSIDSRILRIRDYLCIDEIAGMLASVERCNPAQQLHAREIIEQLAAILDRIDARQFGLEWREAQLFCLCFVHVAAIEIADELLVGAG